MKHSFAKVWLNRLGNKIYINDKNFLGQDLDKLQGKFKITPLKTFINMGEELVDEEELSELSTISYPDMKLKFGLTIYRMRASKLAWRKGQNYILFLAKKKPGTPDEIPESSIRRRGVVIEWDRLNQCVRGVGEDFGTPEGQYKNGDITPWVYYGDKKKKGHNYNILVRRDSYSEISDDLFNEWLGKPKKKNVPLRIKEIPFIITEEGYLLCIPKTRVLPRILIVGKSGKGKSWTLNSLLGRVVYIYQDRVGLLNDSLNQFYELMLPMTQNGMMRELSRIGNTGKYLPAIMLYMSCPKLKIRYADEQIGYRLVIPFTDFLYRWEYYAHGIKKWDIGPPQKYLSKEIVDGLNRCKTTNEVRNFLFGHFSKIQGDGKELEKGMKQMIMKWVAAIDSVLRDEFTSNLFRHEESTAPTWRLKTKNEELIGHPFIISMEAGIIPVINNHLAKTRPIAKKHMANLMNKVVEWQMEREEKAKRIWLFVDELKDFMGRKGDDLYNALDYVFTQGRYNKIGFCGNVQEYTKLSNSMRANSTHLVIFELQTNEERAAVAKDYRLDKEKLDSMAELKTFQCLFTTKEKVILYDKDGRRKIERNGGIWRGKVVPPISVHKSP